MKDFEPYAARERLASLRANAARKLTRQQRAQRRRIYRRTSAVFAVLLLCLLSALCGNAFADSAESPQEPQDPAPMETPAEPAGSSHTAVFEVIRTLPESEPEYYDVPLDHYTQDLVRAACEESGVEMKLALAVIWKETDFQNVTGDDGNSIGYMQIQPRWHKERMERLGVTDLMDPASNFRVGCDFLSELLDKHALAYALTYYNSGKAQVSQYAEDVMNYMEVMHETRKLP